MSDAYPVPDALPCVACHHVPHNNMRRHEAPPDLAACTCRCHATWRLVYQVPLDTEA